MALSIEKYKELKANNGLFWDTDAIGKTGENVSSFLSGVQKQMTAQGAQWTQDEFGTQRMKIEDLRNQLRYMHTYADSIKDSDAAAYDGLMKNYNSLSSGLDGAENWFNKNQSGAKRTEIFEMAKKARSETKQALGTAAAVDTLRKGHSTVTEQAEKYGLDEKELEGTYKGLRAEEKAQDRDIFYGDLSHHKLLAVLKQGSKAQIVSDVNEWFNHINTDEDETAEDWKSAYKKVAGDYNLTADEVEKIYNDSKEVQYATDYASHSLSDEDKSYVIQRLIQTGSVEQLEELKANLPKANYYSGISEQINQAIEDKKEDEYYLKLASDFPELEEYAAAPPKEAETPIERQRQMEDLSRLKTLAGGDEGFNKFLKFRDRYFERQKNAETQRQLSEWTSENPFNAALASVDSTVFNMLGSPLDLLTIARAKIDEWTGGDGWYDTKGTANYTVQNIRETVNEMIANSIDNEQLRRAAQLLYSTGMSIGDMGVAIAANAIPVGGQLVPGSMFFSSAGVSAANEVIENGGSLDQATATLIAQGAAELIFEKISLDKLKVLQATSNVKSVKNLVLNTLKQAGTEGSEEVATSLANLFTDALINGDNSSVNRSVKEYQNQGLSKEEAEKRAWSDWTRSLFDDFLGGAISGGVFGGAVSGINYYKGKGKFQFGNVNVTNAQAAEMLSGDNLQAVKTAKEIVNKQGIDTVLEQAAKSGDEQTRKTAEHFAALEKDGKLDRDDAAQLLVKVIKERAATDAVARMAGVQTTGEHEATVGRIAQQLNGFDYAGNRLEKGMPEIKSSFGVQHPNGIAAELNGKSVTVESIESSMPEYLKDDNTVSVKLSDGTVIDADGLTFNNPDFDRLMNLAKNYDTLGARALLSNYETAAQGGVSVDRYIQDFNRLYELGQSGGDFRHAAQNAYYTAAIEDMGEAAAQAAIAAGLNDGDISSATMAYFQRKVRVKGKAFSKSRVSVERDVKFDVDGDAGKVLQMIAEKTGKEIVLTNALNNDDKARYSSNTIFVNANQAEHAMVAAALHEAVHNLRAYSAGDFRTLQKFVTNYLTESGKNIQQELDSIAAVYGKDAPTPDVVMEELVCKSIEALAADKDALELALTTKKNRPIIKEVGEILKRIADRVMSYFKGDREKGELAHNRYAQAFLDDAKALRDMADIVSRGFESARENEREFGKVTTQTRHSYAGEKALIANHSILAQAKAMEKNGADSEEIRQKTGWHRGYDGKWRFEIDDSGMKIKDMIFTAGTLGDLIEHDTLFKAYPQLKNLRYAFERIENGARAYIFADSSGIILDHSLRTDALRGEKDKLKSILMHEIQHYIQHNEGFASGTNPNDEKQRGSTVVFENEQNAYKELLTAVKEQYDNESSTKEDWKTADALEDIISRIKATDPQSPDFSFMTSKSMIDVVRVSDSEAVISAFQKWISAKYDIGLYDKSPDLWASNRYIRSAGEIEARDSESRRSMTAEQRKEKRPDIDRDDVVFSDGGVSYEINERFYDDFDSWDGSNPSVTFTIGNTSNALQSVGVKNQNIIMRSGMIINKLNKHQEMSKSIFRQIPELLENPVIVQFSDAIDDNTGKPKYDSRITVLGELYTNINGKNAPVLVSIELLPTNQKKTKILDLSVITSAYAKNSLQNYINENSILYINPNKKRTNNWLTLNGLQLPVGENQYGSIRRITYADGKVKTQNPIHMTQMQEKMFKAGLVDEFGNPRFSKDDTIYDDPWDFLDNESKDGKKKVDTEKLLKRQTPDEAVYRLSERIGKRAVETIRSVKDAELTDEEYHAIARRIMKGYNIKIKNNEALENKIAQRVANFAEDIRRSPKSDYSVHMTGLYEACRGYLENSGKYERGFMKETAQKVKSLLRGRTLILPENAATYILGDYGDMQKLNSAYGGYITVAKEADKARVKNPVYMDELMNRLAEIQTVRELFADGKTPDDYTGWGFLDNLIGNVLQPKFVNPYYNNVYENMDDAAIEMANRIAVAVVDEMAGKTANSENADGQAARTLADSRNALVADNQALQKVKYEKYRNLKQVNQYYITLEKTDFRSQYIERQKKNAALRRLGGKLNNWTKRIDGKANKNEYIPEKLKKPLLDVLELFKADPGTYKNGKEKSEPTYFGAFRELTSVQSRVDALAREYAKLEGETDFKDALGFDVNAIAFDKGVLNELHQLSDFIEGKNVYQLNSSELNAILEVINDLDSKLKNAVKLIVDGKETTIQEQAAKGIEQMEKVYYKKDSKAFIKDALRDARNRFVATSLDPVRYGKFLSGYKEGAVWNLLMNDAHKGDQKRVRIMQQAYSAVQEVIAKYSRRELNDLQRKAVGDFTMQDIDTGEDVKLSQGLLLAIYLTNMQEDGHRHLCNERNNHYTRIADLDTLNGNRVLPDVRKKQQKAMGEYSHKVRFDETTLRRIGEYVESTPILKDLSVAMHDVFNGLLADEINLVSMQRYGKMIATVKNYFPLRVDSKDPNKQFNTSFEGENIFTDERMKSRGFTKQRTYSETAIVIGDALNVFQRHVNETAEYCGMLIPVENIKKVINSDNGKITMREEIEKKFGSSAIHYLDKLLSDIQKRKDNIDENLLTNLSGHAMGAALAFNPRSWLKNYGALPLANKHFGTANVAKAVAATKAGWGKTGKDLVEKYNSYTPYMWYREQGNGTIVGELSRQHGLYGKFTDAVDMMSKFDRAVVNLLLYASEQNVKQTTNIEVDSEEFKKEVAKRFEKCVDESQPNSMITSKPQFVRNNVMRVLSLNAFASQRMAMGNSLMDSFMEYRARSYENKIENTPETKSAAKKALKGFFSTFFGVLQSVGLQDLLGVLATVLIFHKWDDLKDEKGNVTPSSALFGVGKMWLKGFPEEFFGSFAWADRAYSFVEKRIDNNAYSSDFNVMSFSAIEDIAKNIESGNWAKAYGRFADLAGLPAFGGSNTQKLVQSGYSYINDLIQGRLGYTGNNGKVDLEYMDAWILNAVYSGDNKKAQGLINTWVQKHAQQYPDGGVEGAEKYVNGKLIEALADYEDVKQAAALRFEGKYKAADELTRELVKGAVTQEMLNSALTKAQNKILKDEADSADSTDSENTPPQKYQLKDAFAALKNGETDSYEQVKGELAQWYVDAGQKENIEEAEKHIESQMRSANRTDPLFEELEAATDGSDKARLDRIWKQLDNVFGSRNAALEAYGRYKERKNK